MTQASLIGLFSESRRDREYKYTLTCENVGISVFGSVVFLKRGLRRERLSRLDRLKKKIEPRYDLCS